MAITQVDSRQVKYISLGIGAVNRKAQDKMRESVSVLDFGAVGDGITDDTAAFLLVAANNKPIDLCGLAYKVNTNATIPLTAPMYNGTIVVGTTPTGNLFTVGGDDVFIKDVNFIGGSGVLSTALVVLSMATNFKIAWNNFTGFTNGGIVAQSGSTGGVIANNVLDACSATLSGDQYGAISSNANNCVISGNIITDCEQTGISVFAVSNVVIADNIISGDGVSVKSGGIISDGKTTDLTIRGNTIKNVNVEGIQVAGNSTTYLGPTSRIIIVDNIITESAYSGITLYSADTDGIVLVSISGNTISKAASTQWAIQLDRVAYVTVSGNTLSGYATGVRQDNSCSYTNINGNIIMNFSGIGISAGASYGNVCHNIIQGIVASSTGVSANSAATAGNILIAQNNISDCLIGIESVFTITNSIAVRSNYLKGNTTNLSYTSANANSSIDNLIGDNVLAGFVTLNGTTEVFISNAAVVAGDKINLIFTNYGAGSELTTGAVFVARIVESIGFGVRSTGATDVSNYRYEIIR